MNLPHLFLSFFAGYLPGSDFKKKDTFFAVNRVVAPHTPLLGSSRTAISIFFEVNFHAPFDEVNI